MIYKPRVPETEAAPEPVPSPEREVVTLVVDGAPYEVTKRRVTIGRSRECDIRLADPNASRKHAELRQDGATYWIVDLDSTNGVEVNGTRTRRAKLRARRHRHDRRHEARVPPGAAVTVGSAAVEEVLLALKLAFLVLLYLFIWAIVRSASRDIRAPQQDSVVLAPQTQAQRQQATPAPPQGRLVVVHSAALPIAQEFRVNAAPLTFGRGGQNDVPLDGDEFVSARHARFQARRDGAWVEDVGSTNGTFVNGERLTGPRLLKPGDTITVGETELRYQR